jgi:hypothetical protein
MTLQAVDVSIAELISFVPKVCNLGLYCKDIESTNYAAGFLARKCLIMYSLFAVDLRGQLLYSSSVFLFLTHRGVDCLVIKGRW